MAFISICKRGEENERKWKLIFQSVVMITIFIKNFRVEKRGQHNGKKRNDV